MFEELQVKSNVENGELTNRRVCYFARWQASRWN